MPEPAHTPTGSEPAGPRHRAPAGDAGGRSRRTRRAAVVVATFATLAIVPVALTLGVPLPTSSGTGSFGAGSLGIGAATGAEAPTVAAPGVHGAGHGTGLTVPAGTVQTVPAAATQDLEVPDGEGAPSTTEAPEGEAGDATGTAEPTSAPGSTTPETSAPGSTTESAAPESAAPATTGSDVPATDATDDPATGAPAAPAPTGLDVLGTDCAPSNLAPHTGFQEAPRCVATAFGEVAAAAQNPSLLITDAPDTVAVDEPFTLSVSTRNLVRDRFLGAAVGGYYAESSFLTPEGIQRGHFHTACRMLDSLDVAPDPEPVPAFFLATQDNGGGADPDTVQIQVTGMPSAGTAQCAVWAGDGSHRLPMMERANQTPAFDIVRITVG